MTDKLSAFAAQQSNIDSGYGDGNGNGSGSGSGFGFGFGNGFGNGCGYGIKKYNGKPIYDIDGIDTVLTSVRGNVAKGVILRSDLTIEPCYVVKQGNTFAHGKTLRDAMSAQREKLFEDMPEEKRIKAFIAEHKPGVKYPCRDLYEWHHRLTGSCKVGRKAFAAEHGIDIDKDLMTVDEFIWLTRIAYGGDVIRKLEEAWVEK